MPKQRIALAGHGEDADAVEMAVALLVGADRHFRGMRADGVVGQHETQHGAACPARRPGLQLKGRKVGDEIGFPLMPARPDADEFAFAREIFLAADPFGELCSGN